LPGFLIAAAHNPTNNKPVESKIQARLSKMSGGHPIPALELDMDGVFLYSDQEVFEIIGSLRGQSSHELEPQQARRL